MHDHKINSSLTAYLIIMLLKIDPRLSEYFCQHLQYLLMFIEKLSDSPQCTLGDITLPSLFFSS